MNKHSKTETDSQIYGINRWLQEGRGFLEGEKYVREHKRYNFYLQNK